MSNENYLNEYFWHVMDENADRVRVSTPSELIAHLSEAQERLSSFEASISVSELEAVCGGIAVACRQVTDSARRERAMEVKV